MIDIAPDNKILTYITIATIGILVLNAIIYFGVKSKQPKEKTLIDSLSASGGFNQEVSPETIKSLSVPQAVLGLGGPSSTVIKSLSAQ